MALVHPNSCECTKSELDLFEVPPTQTSVAYGYWEQKGLTSALTDQGPYEFAVSGAGTTTLTWLMPVPSQGHYGFHSFPVVD